MSDKNLFQWRAGMVTQNDLLLLKSGKNEE